VLTYVASHPQERIVCVNTRTETVILLHSARSLLPPSPLAMPLPPPPALCIQFDILLACCLPTFSFVLLVRRGDQEVPKRLGISNSQKRLEARFVDGQHIGSHDRHPDHQMN
jgi:hypothetical protein